MKRYEQYLSVNIVSDVSDTLVAKIKENTAELPGVTIEQDYIRQYEDSKYFSNITGYCGQISEDELEYYKQAGNSSYASGDIVGKTGIEKSFEEELQGKKAIRPFMLTVSEMFWRLLKESNRLREIISI